MTQPQIAPNTPTEELIAALASAPLPPAPAAGRAAVLLLGAGLAGIALYLGSMGVRPDLLAALSAPVTLAKTLLPLVLLAVALPAALRLTRPGAAVRLWPLAVPLALSLLLVVLAALSAPPGQILRLVIGQTAVKCLSSITLLSLVPIVLATLVLRRGAPTRPVLAGAMVGLAAGACAAAGYALTCGEDSPLFYVTWYGGAILAATGLGALVGGRLLRW